MSQTQLEIVKEKLDRESMVSRNWCLQRRITRLGAIICILKKCGYDFDAKYRDGDYVYQIKKPEQLSLV